MRVILERSPLAKVKGRNKKKSIGQHTRQRQEKNRLSNT